MFELKSISYEPDELIQVLRTLLRKREEEVIEQAQAGPQATSTMRNALLKAGSLIRNAIINEALRGFNKLGWDTKAFKNVCDLEVEVVGTTVEVYGKLFIDDNTIVEARKKKLTLEEQKSFGRKPRKPRKTSSKKETGELSSQRDTKTGPGAMDSSRSSKSPERSKGPGSSKMGTGKYGSHKKPKKYPMLMKGGKVLVKTLPMKLGEQKDLWIHPRLTDNGFIKRGLQKSWPSAWKIIQKALKHERG